MAKRIPASITRGPCMNNCLNRLNLEIQAADYFNLQDDLSDSAVEIIMVAIRAEAERRNALALDQTVPEQP